jgi:hypothetical protein
MSKKSTPGAPPRPAAKRKPMGRPTYRPSIEDRVAVEQMRYCGESDNVIARALRISPHTLRKHFADELENGHANRRREVIGLLFESAKNGNISAQKTLQDIGRVAGAAEAIDRRSEPAPAKVGKKEEQQAAAERVTGKFAPPTPPKLVVSNG